ncbi:uncharacterized protein LOC143605318 [Bidens hawaiensis]|uniref:uncharacterized protein LOC143605318 n=1 Tax=Bidens hawaiensis TaxID=980011 RepID=UPI004049A73D
MDFRLLLCFKLKFSHGAKRLNLCLLKGLLTVWIELICGKLHDIRFSAWWLQHHNMHWLFYTADKFDMGGSAKVLGAAKALGNINYKTLQDKAHEKNQKYKGKSILEQFKLLAKTEGIGSMWSGSSLTMNHTMLVTASQLPSYDQIKEPILDKGVIEDWLGIHVTAVLLQGSWLR